jgi:hypothetical protein
MVVELTSQGPNGGFMNKFSLVVEVRPIKGKIDHQTLYTFSCNAQEKLELQGKIPKESNEARHEELRKCIQKTLSTLNLQNCE